ncbi:MAG: Maf family protein [Nanoarchaeota archaeon]
MKIILASGSPRRIALAKKLNLPFSVEPGDFSEDLTLPLPPRALAMHLAVGKAKAVARTKREGVVIGVDTFVVLGKNKLGKPKTKAQAVAMLESLSGRTVHVISGIALINCETKRVMKAAEVTEVRFKRLSNATIQDYVVTGEPLDKAGAFAIQGRGADLIAGIRGSKENVIGFPVARVKSLLAKCKSVS